MIARLLRLLAVKRAKPHDALWTEQDHADRRARIERTFPQVSGPLDPAEREGRRVCETAEQELRARVKGSREQ